MCPMDYYHQHHELDDFIQIGKRKKTIALAFENFIRQINRIGTVEPTIIMKYGSCGSAIRMPGSLGDQSDRSTGNDFGA